MNNKKRLLFLYITIILIPIYFFFGFLSLAYSQPSDKESPSAITDIKIEGNKVVSNNTVLSKIKTRKGDIYSQKAVNEDI